MKDYAEKDGYRVALMERGDPDMRIDEQEDWPAVIWGLPDVRMFGLFRGEEAVVYMMVRLPEDGEPHPRIAWRYVRDDHSNKHLSHLLLEAGTKYLAKETTYPTLVGRIATSNQRSFTAASHNTRQVYKGIVDHPEDGESHVFETDLNSLRSGPQ